MIINDGYRTEITRGTARYKFGGDPMAEYLYSLDHDEYTGDSDFGLYVSLFGKRLLISDDHGFVWVEKHATTSEAREAFDAYDHDYLDWLNDVTCNSCGTHFSSEEGSCWCCGARNYTERDR